jgi:hypothetical protein
VPSYRRRPVRLDLSSLSITRGSIAIGAVLGAATVYRTDTAGIGSDVDLHPSTLSR